MNFSKIITKNSIWILTWSKWSTSRLTMREMKISRIKLRSFLEMKKIIHNDEWKSQIFRRLIASNAILFRSCFFCWLRQMTNNQKISINWQRSIKISIKKYFFILTSLLNCYWDNNSQKKKIMLRFRFEYEYVTFNHWHDRNHIELNNSTNLTNSLINRINSISIIMFKSFAMRNRKWV
jgi:hypothetical protein